MKLKYIDEIETIKELDREVIKYAKQVMDFAKALMETSQDSNTLLQVSTKFAGLSGDFENIAKRKAKLTV